MRCPFAPGAHHPSLEQFVSTTSQSEAANFTVSTAWRKWQYARKAAGKPYDTPNIVMDAAVQVYWEEATRHRGIEDRYYGLSTSGRSILQLKEVADLVDENTILVCVTLGSPYTRTYEDIVALNDLLEEKNQEQGLDVHIHVDAAFSGFVTPSLNPQHKWNFRVPLVCSVNVSGHKYGLACAGTGCVCWRSKDFLLEEILFKDDYLGSFHVSFMPNFPNSSMQGIRYPLLGKFGYRDIRRNFTQTAELMAESVSKLRGGSKFILEKRTGGNNLPLLSWRLAKKQKPDESEFPTVQDEHTTHPIEPPNANINPNEQAPNRTVNFEERNRNTGFPTRIECNNCNIRIIRDNIAVGNGGPAFTHWNEVAK